MVFEVMEGVPGLPFWFAMAHAGPHRNFHYLAGATGGDSAVVVDPAFELPRLFGLARDEGREVRHALFTHGHWDHIGGAPEAVALGVTDLWIHAAGATHPKLLEAERAGGRIHACADGDRMDLAGVPFEILHTPGHQPEASCWLAGPAGGPKALFGGDTLFIGSCGRTDFPGGDTHAMLASMARLRSLAGPLPVHVMPGHHYARHATRPLADEVRDNPALSVHGAAAFQALPFLRG